MDTLRSDIHYYFVEHGFSFEGDNTYTKDNIRIEYDDFYTQYFKYYENGELKHLFKDDLNISKIKNIIRNIKIENLLDG